MKKSVFFFGMLLFVASSAFGQWTDFGSFLRTYDNVGVGGSPGNMRLSVKQSQNNLNYSALQLKNTGNQSSYLWMDGGHNFRIDNSTTGARDIIFNQNGTGGVGIGSAPGNLKLSVKQSQNTLGSSAMSVKNTGNQSTYFWMDGSDRMHIDNSTTGARNIIFNGSGYGRIGIGTNNPDEKLTVNGSIHAKEIKVDLSIPADYVFQKYYTGVSALKDDYNLPTIKEVAAFTKENHHLPNIPSAKQIQTDGLHLKEMTNLLLQKIEELTLYTIEQEQRILTLEGDLKELKSLKVE